MGIGEAKETMKMINYATLELDSYLYKEILKESNMTSDELKKLIQESRIIRLAMVNYG